MSLQDAWSDQRGQLHLDSQQDYQLLQAQKTPEGLYLLFKRPFRTCDPKDYFIEVGGGPTRQRECGPAWTSLAFWKKPRRPSFPGLDLGPARCEAGQSFPPVRASVCPDVKWGRGIR